MDIFRRKVWYSYKSDPSRFIELNLDKVQEIVSLNKKEDFPESLEMYVQTYIEVAKPDYENVVGQDSITRFDKKSSSKKSNKKRSNRKSSKKPSANVKSSEGSPSNKPGRNQKQVQSQKKNQSSNPNRKNSAQRNTPKTKES